MKPKKDFVIIALSIFLFLTVIGFNNIMAQEEAQYSDTTRNGALRLFMDCRYCDMNYIRQEMPFVNFVRDVREAQLYLMITRQSTGSGGSSYTLFFSGQDARFSSMKDTLTFDSSPDDTPDIVREGLTNTIAMGLMRYVAKTPVKKNVSVSYRDEGSKEYLSLEDKWNFWVFELETQPKLSLEKSEEEYSWRNNARINRITPEWKLLNNFNHSYNLDIFYRESEEDETGEISIVKVEAERKSWSFNNLTVKSINDHWSAGLRAGVSSSSYSNLDLAMRFAPAIEYNFFPYYESNQKQLTVLYGVSFKYNNYTDTTVYDKLAEKLFEQSLDVSFQLQQKWGSVNLSFRASNYLHDFKKNEVELDGFIRIRLFKGLSLNLNAGVELIHNQIELAKGGRSPEDVYLRLKELQTNYRFDTGLGISYTFGSIYNNVVNPRF